MPKKTAPQNTGLFNKMLGSIAKGVGTATSSHPVDSLLGFVSPDLLAMKLDAEKAGNAYPVADRWNGPGDAMRHLMFSSKLADRYGQIPSQLESLAHEYLLNFGESSAEREMDLYNDTLGRSIAGQTSDPAEMQRLAQKYVDEGTAKTIKGKEGAPSNYGGGGAVIKAAERAAARAVEKSAAKPVLHAAPNVVNMNNIPDEKEGYLRLYHGGSEEGFTSVPDSSTTAGFSFDGLFAHPEKRSSWGAHGNGSNYFADIKEPEILTQNALDYHIPYENTVAALKKAMPWLNDNDVDLAHSAVIEDKNVHDMDANDVSRVFRADDPGQASWEAQRLRGNVARNLGYKAVEMGDEHGTSYLMMPGVPLTQVIETDSSDLGHAHGGLIGLAQKYGGGGLIRKYDEGGDVAVPDTQPSIMGALKDPQFRQDVANNFRDAAYRGAVAGTLGAPVDIANMLANLGTAGYGYLGNKAGMLRGSEMPATYNEPVGGSEWIGNKLRDYGVIGGNRNLTAEVIAGLGLPLVPVAAEARIPQMDRALEQMAANYAAKDDLNAGAFGQRGAIKLRGGNWLKGSIEESLNGLKARTMNEFELKNLAESQGVDVAERMRINQQPAEALNNWVDKTLTKYVKNDMGTPEDPLRIMADKHAVDKPAKLAEVQGRIDAFAAKMEQTARERGVPVEYLTSMRQEMIGLEKEKALVEARQGLHFEPQQRGPQIIEDLRHNREMEGFPGAGFGQSELARRWETATDKVIHPEQARDILRGPNYVNAAIAKAHVDHSLANDPWLLKVPPETKVYDLPATMRPPEHLGFDHLIDELRNATNPESGLPKELLINPKDLPKITMEQAVDRVADINAWRAAQKVEANKAMANNPATFTHKEYPEQGMKWVQLKRPEAVLEEGHVPGAVSGYPDLHGIIDQRTGQSVSPGRYNPEEAMDLYKREERTKSLADALKHEGDTMRHSVGGYGVKGGYGAGGIDAILDGRASIFSLRDAEGRSYATIEVRKGKQLNDPTQGLSQSISNTIDPKLLQEYHEEFARSGEHSMYFAKNFWPWLKQTHPETYEAMTKVGKPIIQQIKGVGNAAVKKEYWPLVQDFVKSGSWSGVNDLHNTGLSNVGGRYFTEPELVEAAKKYGRMGVQDTTWEVAKQRHIDAGMTEERALENWVEGFREGRGRLDIPPEGFAAGGSVRAYDPSRVDQIMNSINTPSNYAAGGLAELANKYEGGPCYQFKHDDHDEHFNFGGGGGVAKAMREWLKDHPEKSLQKLKMTAGGEDPAQLLKAMEEGTDPNPSAHMLEQMPSIKAKGAINNWIDSTLKNYVRRDYGQEWDPLSQLTPEQRHVPLMDEQYRKEQINAVWPPRNTINKRNPAGITTVTRAQLENPQLREQYQKPDYLESIYKENPWMLNKGMDEPISSFDSYGLGLEHLTDELHNATRPDSDLPDQLRIRPESLSRMSMSQASQLVGKINEYRAALKAANAQKALLTPYKEYKSGHKWVELPDASDPQGLKAVMDTGCEGGWCTMGEDEARGYSRAADGRKLYALIDPEGKPHVQAYTVKNNLDPNSLNSGYHLDPNSTRIQEIKPRGNKWDSQYVQDAMAKNPQYKEELMPYVQDFVKSGNWSRVNDIENTDLTHRGDLQYHIEDNKVLPGVAPEVGLAALDRAKAANALPEYMTHPEATEALSKFLPSPEEQAQISADLVHLFKKNNPGMAKGGIVEMAHKYDVGGLASSDIRLKGMEAPEDYYDQDQRSKTGIDMLDYMLDPYYAIKAGIKSGDMPSTAHYKNDDGSEGSYTLPGWVHSLIGLGNFVPGVNTPRSAASGIATGESVDHALRNQGLANKDDLPLDLQAYQTLGESIGQLPLMPVRTVTALRPLLAGATELASSGMAKGIPKAFMDLLGAIPEYLGPTMHHSPVNLMKSTAGGMALVPAINALREMDEKYPGADLQGMLDQLQSPTSRINHMTDSDIREQTSQRHPLTQAEASRISDNVRREMLPGFAGGGAFATIEKAAARAAEKSAAKAPSKVPLNTILPSAEDVPENLYGAADRAAAGRKAAELIKSQELIKASEALGQAMEQGFTKTSTTQADRTRVGGGGIGGAAFSALSEVDPEYAGKVWGVMNPGTAKRLTNLTTPQTAWTTMLGSGTQLKSNPVVFDKLQRAFVKSMKEGNLSPELADKINQNLALTFGEGADIRDPSIWNQADTFEKRGALADLMMGEGKSPKEGGIALGGEKSGRGVIFKPTDILMRETEPGLLHPEHGGNVPTYALGPRLFSLNTNVQYRPDLQTGFPTLIGGKDLNVNMIPTPSPIYLRDWYKRFKQVKPNRDVGRLDLTLGLKGEGLPSQDLNDDYIRHLIREGFSHGGSVEFQNLYNKYIG